MRRPVVWFGAAILMAACTTSQEPQVPPSGISLPAETTVEAPSTPLMAPLLADTSLGRALSASLLDDPTLKAGLAGETVASARVAQARAVRRPTVSLGLRAGVSTGDTGNVTPTVGVSQLIFDGGASRNAIVAAEARTRTAAADTRTRLSNRALDAAAAWEELYLARRLVSLARESTTRHADIAKRVQMRIDAGAGRSAEALRIEARQADAAASLASAEGRLGEARTRVRELFGRQYDVGPLPAAPRLEGTAAASPVIDALRADLAAAHADLEVRRAERYPSVFFDINGQLDDNDEPAFGAGLRLDYAVGTTGRREAAIQVAQAEVKRLEAELELALSELRRTERSALARQSALRGEARAAQRAEVAARRALANAEVSFDSGRVDILDLLDLGRELDQAARRRVTVESAARLAGFERLASTGMILDVFGIAVPNAGARS